MAKNKWEGKGTRLGTLRKARSPFVPWHGAFEWGGCVAVNKGVGQHGHGRGVWSVLRIFVSSE